MATEMTRIAQMSETERSLVNTLSPAERKTALVEAATSAVRRLLAAHDAHIAAQAAYDAAHPFDPFAPLDTPLPPRETAQAQAGRMIAERGLLLALATQLRTLTETPTPSDEMRETAMQLVLTAKE